MSLGSRLVLFGWLVLSLGLQGWGFFVHRHLNRVAVEALPAPLGPWMASETEWLSAHAVDADKRKHRVQREAPKHFLDLDAPALSCLDSLGLHPNWTAACAACSEDLWAYGVLPWNIEWTYRRLVKAMHEGNGVGFFGGQRPRSLCERAMSPFTTLVQRPIDGPAEHSG